MPGRYHLARGDAGTPTEVAFELAHYDRSRPLVIDPVLSFSTYLGGSGSDYGTDIEVDADGFVYVTGRTASLNFPLRNPLQPGPGGGQPANNEGTDSFISKLSPNGSQLVFSTYLGGSNLDLANAIALDSQLNVYVAGQTGSSNFPVRNALDPTFNGSWDGYLAKLSADGASLLFYT